jgi:hypothetical protein
LTIENPVTAFAPQKTKRSRSRVQTAHRFISELRQGFPAIEEIEYECLSIEIPTAPIFLTLICEKTVNFDFVMTLPEAKRIPLRSILTPTDFDQRLAFRDRISCPLDHISLFRQIAALRDNAHCTHGPGWDWLEAIGHRSAFADRAGALLPGL